MRELRALEEPYRTTVLQRFHEGLSAAEIARREGLPEGTVRWRTKQGLDRLRARLEQAYGGSHALVAVLGELARGPSAAPAAATAGTIVTGTLMGIGSKGIVVGAAGAALFVAGIGAAVLREQKGSAEERRSSPAVLAEAGRQVETEESLAPAPGEAETRVPLAAESPGSDRARGRGHARLRVLESDGTPNAERLVVLPGRAGAEPESRRTDRDGWLELPAREGRHEIVIERLGAFPFRTVIELAAAEQELTLPEGEVLDGRIVVDGGAPPRPIALESFPAASEGVQTFLGGAGPEHTLQTEFATGRTDAGGRFLFRGLRPGQGYNLRLAQGYARPGTPPFAQLGGLVQFHVPGPARGLVFEVERLPCIWGRLVEADGVTPTAGVLDCRFTWEDGTNMDAGARADAEGFFELVPGEAWRAIELEYWGSPGERGKTRAAFGRSQAPEGNLGDLLLARGRTVRLRVTDPGGRPIAGARTDLETEPTDGNGETLLCELTSASFRVAARGHRDAECTVTAGAGETQVVVLEPAPELFLEIRDAAGRPLGGALVELAASRPFFPGAAGLRMRPSTLLSDAREGRLLTWDEGPSDRGSFVARFAADEQGRLRIDSLQPEVALTLRVVARGGTVVYEEDLLPLGHDERRSLPVEVDALLVELRGRVVDERGEPVSGASIGLPAVRSGSSTHSSYDRTDPDGRFSSSLLDLPGLRITVTKKGHCTLVREFPRVPEEELVLVLERGRQVVVRVMDEEGRPQAGGRVSVRASGATSSREAGEVAAGRFEIGELEAGPHEFELRIAGEILSRLHDTLEAELVFRVPVMGSLESSWDLPADEKTTGWMGLELVRAGSEERVAEYTFIETPQGSHRFDPVLPGDYELVLWADWSGEPSEAAELARRTLTVRPRETTSVAF